MENTGIGLNTTVANMANPTASLAGNFSSTALQAGGQAANTAAQQQGTYNASLAPTMNLYGNAGNTFNGVASQQLQQQRDDNAGYAGLGSAIGQLGAAYFLSDKKAKKVHGKVSGKAALRSLEDREVKDWTYKRGLGDSGRHIGRMAGKGDPMGRDGLRRIDAASESGTHHAAITELSKKVKRLERRLSLADASNAKVRRQA